MTTALIIIHSRTHTHTHTRTDSIHSPLIKILATSTPHTAFRSSLLYNDISLLKSNPLTYRKL